jgi:type II secretory pathway component GspD/PulD (secretin)
VPFVNRIPILGWFFKSTSRSSQITETVIFVKATIVNSGQAPSKHDREFQEKFDTTTQPFFD